MDIVICYSVIMVVNIPIYIDRRPKPPFPQTKQSVFHTTRIQNNLFRSSPLCHWRAWMGKRRYAFQSGTKVSGMITIPLCWWFCWLIMRLSSTKSQAWIHRLSNRISLSQQVGKIKVHLSSKGQLCTDSFLNLIIQNALSCILIYGSFLFWIVYWFMIMHHACEILFE